MSKLLVATHNQAKLNEIKQFLAPLLPHVQIVSLANLDIKNEPRETGKTFKENAQLKAEYYGTISKLPTLADDGGLVIDALGGEPGINSNRWLGRRGSDKELVSYCLSRMMNIADNKRTARFETCIYFYDLDKNRRIYQSGTVEGSISQKSSRKMQLGYPYRSIFIVSKFGKLYLDLSEKEHAQINHRYQALNRIAQKLKTWYN